MRLEEAWHIIVYGGTFDPPTRAHVELPAIVRERVGADLVAYVPAAQSPLKLGRPPTPAHHRLAMLQLALQDQKLARVLTDELDRAADGNPSYTVDTLRSLKARLRPGTALRLLIGADQYRLFGKWREAEEIIRLAEPIVLVRPPETREALRRSPPPVGPAEAWGDRFVEAPQMDLSATAVRERIAVGEPIDHLVPPAVAEYIAAHGLYR